ncbi:hypothetical protein F4604DRAFT_1676583 [Suillus subluteus]|nr:hypothetical protein F4604DRAFT_1676583 [Suillus subluteus]
MTLSLLLIIDEGTPHLNVVQAQEVLDKWLERRRIGIPDGWRLLDGIPCIIGGLTGLLARHGYILENYLENILMPGERRATLAKNKGIHDLSIHEWCVLADALKNNSLTVKTVTTDALENLMASRVPVIVGEAPSADSRHTRGRQGFADGQIDRLGLSHLGNTTPPKSCPITAIRNDEVGVGAIKDGAIDDEEAANDATMEDEEEIDELFASQERT